MFHFWPKLLILIPQTSSAMVLFLSSQSKLPDAELYVCLCEVTSMQCCCVCTVYICLCWFQVKVSLWHMYTIEAYNIWSLLCHPKFLQCCLQSQIYEISWFLQWIIEYSRKMHNLQLWGWTLLLHQEEESNVEEESILRGIFLIKEKNMKFSQLFSSMRKKAPIKCVRLKTWHREEKGKWDWKKEKEGSTILWPSLSALLDGNRKPNVKFRRATVVTSIVPTSNTSRTAQSIRSNNNNNNNNNKPLTIFFSL